MALEINGLNSNPSNTSKAKSGQGVAAPKGKQADNAPTTEAKATDTVKISAEAKLLSQVSDQLGADTPVNREKVEALKAAIADGSYQVDAQSVAKKMMDLDTKF